MLITSKFSPAQYSYKKNDEIRICHYDNGGEIAILNKMDYYSKLNTIIKDQTKFVKVDVDPEENQPAIAKAQLNTK